MRPLFPLPVRLPGFQRRRTPLKGHTVLLTGATSGIGLAIADHIATKDLKTLVLVSRTKSALDDLAAKLEEKYPPLQCLPIAQDLSEPGAAQKVYNTVKKKGLSVTVLIPNAGVAKAGRFEDHPVEAYDAMLELNVKSVVGLSRLCLPDLLENARGGILFISSITGYTPVPLFSAYAASKAMVTSFAEALHEEYRDRGLAIVCATPGGTVSSVGASNFGREAGMAVEKIKLAGFLPSPLEECSQVAQSAVGSLEGAMQGPQWRLNSVAFTSNTSWALMLIRHVLPRWFMARLQAVSIRGSVQPPQPPARSGDRSSDAKRSL